MITIRTLPQLKSFLERNEHLKCRVGYKFRNRPGFHFTMVREHYEEFCNYGEHELVLCDTEDVHCAVFVPKARPLTSKRYMVDTALNMCDPEQYPEEPLPF